MADWLHIVLPIVLVLGVVIVRRERIGGAFLGLFFGLGMATWVAFASSGGRLERWMVEELAYWEDAAGPVVVGAALVLIVVIAMHILMRLARLLSAGPRRPDTSAVTPGLYTAPGSRSDWSVFPDDDGGGFEAGESGGGDCGGVD